MNVLGEVLSKKNRTKKPKEGKLVVSNIMWNRVLFVERSGESRVLARLRTESPQPKGNQVLTGRLVCTRVPETG